MNPRRAALHVGLCRLGLLLVGAGGLGALVLAASVMRPTFFRAVSCALAECSGTVLYFYASYKLR
jgi:hypothetical protein